MTWENVNKHNGIVRIGAESTFGTTSSNMKALLNRAAAMRGQKLSEFMLESARREAENALLDQRSFFLDDERHAAFVAMLDAPPAPSEKLKKLLRRKPAWDR